MSKYHLQELSERCNQKLYTHGICIGVYDTSYMGADGFEGVIRETRNTTGRPCDWHYMGGRAVVKVFEGDEQATIDTLNPIFSRVYNELGPKWCKENGMTWREGKKGYTNDLNGVEKVATWHESSRYTNE